MSKIHILGASGSGTTTVAKEIANKYNYIHLDTDDFFWEKTAIPYTKKRPVKERIELIKRRLCENQNVVLSGIFYPWGDELKDYFDYMIYLETKPEVRLKRLINREYRMYGKRMLKGGDMHEQFKRFLKWDLNYEKDTNDDIGKTRTEEWLKTVKSKVIRIDGGLPLRQIMSEIEKINLKTENRGDFEDDYTI